MRSLRYDLHLHSCLSPCGDMDMTPCNIAGMAHLNELDLVALTDHNTTDNCPAFFAACEEYGIVPVAGMELTTAEDVHLLCVFETLEDATSFGEEVRTHRMRIKNRVEIFGEQAILNERDEKIGEDPYFLPAATDLDLEAAAKLVAAHNGVCWPAHIDRDANGLLAVLGFFPPKPEFRIAELRDAKNRKLAGDRAVVVCSNAHRLWEIGEAGGCLTLDTDATDAETVRRALFSNLREGKL
ncbi:MAG: PHP domain-containing protein [Clostridia bacterium]|nr:PHP domain-containing protein [Clostridia bacterium]